MWAVNKHERWNPVILWIEVWSSKWVQKVLDKIWTLDKWDFETVNAEMREILKYPGIWNIWNCSRFLDVFNPFVKRHHKNNERRLSLIGTWNKFEELKAEQEIAWVTISVEDKVNDRLSWRWNWTYHHWGAQGLWWIWALSIWK